MFADRPFRQERPAIRAAIYAAFALLVPPPILLLTGVIPSRPVLDLPPLLACYAAGLGCVALAVALLLHSRGRPTSG